MHDGRFRKLNQVVKHYTTSFGQKHSNNQSIELTPEERVDLIAFLLTLNDKTFVFDKKHQFPKEILLRSEGK